MTPIRALAASAALLALLSASPALGDGRFALGLTAGSLGLGPEVSLRPFEKIGVRGSVTWLGFTLNDDIDGVEYDGETDLLSVGAMTDWYLFDGGLRISAGARWNGNAVDLSATPANDVTLGGSTYTPAEIGRLAGTVDANQFAPLLTIGWGGKLKSGLTIGVEAGFMYQGSPEISDLRAIGGQLEADPGLVADLEAEEERIENEVESYKYLPILQVVLLYRF